MGKVSLGIQNILELIFRYDEVTSTTYFQEMVIYENPFKIHLPQDYEILDRFQEFSKEAIQMLLTLELLCSASDSGLHIPDF